MSPKKSRVKSKRGYKPKATKKRGKHGLSPLTKKSLAKSKQKDKSGITKKKKKRKISPIIKKLLLSYAKKKEKIKRLKKCLCHNFHIKLFSLACALVLFFYVMNQQQRNFITFNNMPLNFSNVPTDLIPYASPKAVSIKLQGEQNIIMGMDKEQVKVYLDLKDKKNGSFLYSSSDLQVEHPEKAKVVNIEPKTIKVTLDLLVTKDIVIQPTIIGQPSAGCKIERIILSPEKLKIYGPKSKLDVLTEIPTTPIRINNIRKNTTAIVRTDLLENDLQILNNEPIIVSISLVQPYIEKKITNVPLEFRGLSPLLNIQSTEDKVTLVLGGPQSTIFPLKAEDITAFIDVRGLSQGIYRLKLKIIVPPKVKIVSATPTISEVTLSSKLKFKNMDSQKKNN